MDVALDTFLESIVGNGDIVRSNSEVREEKEPLEVVVTTVCWPVSTLTQTTRASGTAAPEGSVTVPVSDAVD